MKNFVLGFMTAVLFCFSMVMRAEQLGPGKPTEVSPAQAAKLGMTYPVPKDCGYMTVVGKSFVIASTSKFHEPQAEIDEPMKIICKKRY
jgi:hypothetical protein